MQGAKGPLTFVGGVGGVSRGAGDNGSVSVIGSPEGVAAIRGKKPMLARC